MTVFSLVYLVPDGLAAALRGLLVGLYGQAFLLGALLASQQLQGQCRHSVGLDSLNMIHIQLRIKVTRVMGWFSC